MFEEFSADQALGLVENQSNWYVKMFSNGQRPWPALDRGFNTGVMLMHLQRLRKEEFVSSWANVTRHVLRYIPETSLADQDVINALIKERPGIVYRIECTWNIQLSDRTTSYTCYRDNSLINVRRSRTRTPLCESDRLCASDFCFLCLFRSFIGIHRASKTFAIGTLTTFESCTGSSSKWTAICCENAYSAVTSTRVYFQ